MPLTFDYQANSMMFQNRITGETFTINNGETKQYLNFTFKINSMNQALQKASLTINSSDSSKINLNKIYSKKGQEMKLPLVSEFPKRVYLINTFLRGLLFKTVEIDANPYTVSQTYSNNFISDGTEVGLSGVAPDAKIISYKVLDSAGSGSTSGVIEGIEMAVDPNQDGDFSDHADIISMSLGGGGDPDDPISSAIDNAVNVGVVSVIAAGNDGPAAGTIGSPGTAREAITVGASDKNDIIADFSSRGPVVWSNGTINKPDVLAPGVDICAAEHDSAWNDRKCIDQKHVAISGTSMATPHVSGVVALLKQKFPSLTPEEIKGIVKSTSIDLGYDINTQGSGRIDANNAINTKIIISGDLEFGRLENGVYGLGKKIKIRNVYNQPISLSFNYTDPIDSKSKITLHNSLSMKGSLSNIQPGEEREIEIDLVIPKGFDGFYNGRAVFTDSINSYSLTYSFYKASRLNVTLEGDHYPNIIIFNDDFSEAISSGQGASVGNNFQFDLVAGNYTVFLINDFTNPKDPINFPEKDEYIIGEKISIPSESEISKTFRLDDYRKFLLRANSLSGKPLDLYEWQRGILAYKGNMNGCNSFYNQSSCENQQNYICYWSTGGCYTKYLQSNFYGDGKGDRYVYLSNNPNDKLNVDITLKYFGGVDE